MALIQSQEHEELSLESLSDELKEKVSALHFSHNGYMKQPKYLGLEWDSNNSLRCNYYIGASWLIENEIAVAVTPKASIENIDFIEMFITALAVDSASEANYFGDCYGIDFEATRITVPEQLCQVTPLILLHYIKLLENLIKQGLKHGYVSREENLKSKIRGRIHISTHIQQNICNRREDRTYCRFQEYTEDTLENRLLKKALLFTCRTIACYKSFEKKKVELQSRLNKLMMAFVNVSDQVEIRQVVHVSHNKLFRHYAEAIRVAKMILHYFDNSITKAEKESSETPPFWIDMPRLFELYAYSKLNQVYPRQLLFQEKGTVGCCDFLKIVANGSSERLIMDAKYKPYYTGNTPIEWNDIQEISGYARDKVLLKKMGWIKDGEINISDIPPCVVIYPEYENGETALDSNGILNNAKEIRNYTNFYKIAIKVPRMDKKLSY